MVNNPTFEDMACPGRSSTWQFCWWPFWGWLSDLQIGDQDLEDVFADSFFFPPSREIHRSSAAYDFTLGILFCRKAKEPIASIPTPSMPSRPKVTPKCLVVILLVAKLGGSRKAWCCWSDGKVVAHFIHQAILTIIRKVRKVVWKCDWFKVFPASWDRNHAWIENGLIWVYNKKCGRNPLIRIFP